MFRLRRWLRRRRRRRLVFRLRRWLRRVPRLGLRLRVMLALRLMLRLGLVLRVAANLQLPLWLSLKLRLRLETVVQAVFEGQVCVQAPYPQYGTFSGASFSQEPHSPVAAVDYSEWSMTSPALARALSAGAFGSTHDLCNDNDSDD